MIKGKKIVVVLPAYNAAKTLARTYSEIPLGVVDEVILVDDASTDLTLEEAGRLGIREVIRHDRNQGYGANQKTCFDRALSLGADIVVMLHPDYQYTPKLIESMVHVIANEVYPVVLGSRILGRGARKGGMPFYKYVLNRILTFAQNTLMHEKLSEYHSGYRAFSAEVLRNINYHADSDDFVFDNQILSQILFKGYPIAEITCPTHYFKEASTINFSRSVVYGVGCMITALKYALQKAGLARFRIYE
ncbi:MAG TPA: glycosyltransferase family 2 protein [Bacteroidales bacterium]|nr:glycosyltransferase family 2 protein [Bacteroidales bacterium]